MSQIAILACVTLKEGMAGQYLAALEPLLVQARKEPGTLLYAVHRSADDRSRKSAPSPSTLKYLRQ